MSGLVISPRYRLSVGEVRLHGRCGAARGRQEAKRSCRRAAVQLPAKVSGTWRILSRQATNAAWLCEPTASLQYTTSLVDGTGARPSFSAGLPCKKVLELLTLRKLPWPPWIRWSALPTLLRLSSSPMARSTEMLLLRRSEL